MPYPEQETTADTHPNRSIFNHKTKLLVALVLLIGALIYFGLIAFRGATVYYLTIGELNQQNPSENGAMVRVSGKLIPESFHRERNSRLAHFILTDESQTLQAVHSGIFPDLFFNEHSEIILEGTYNSSHVFETATVIVKCPSKYIADVKET